jgi:hypothetical protein
LRHELDKVAVFADQDHVALGAGAVENLRVLGTLEFQKA